MKKSILALALPVAALLMQSCSEDDFQEPSRVDSGSSIKFGAVLDMDPATRTWYGDPTTQDGKQVWPINWNPETDPDHIFVYSPNALEGRKQGTYTVHPNAEDPKLAADITVDTESGVQASDAATYNFFALYPASAVTGQATGNTITATVPYEQKVTFVDPTTKEPATIPAAPDPGKAYVTSPDMTNCLMTAYEQDVVLNDNSPVTLKFKPFSSVLDITINGTHDVNIITGSGTCYVTAIQIIADDDAYISGDFRYDFTTGSFEFYNENNRSNIVEISTMGENADGNLAGIPMSNDNTLNIQAFIIPNPAVKNLTVKVISADSQVWTKKLTMTNFQPKQIHKVSLPRLELKENVQFDFANWIGQLDPRIYLSELSLPGTTSSFSYDPKVTDSQTKLQTLNLVEQFRAGVRVFRCHVWLYDVPSDVVGDGGSTSFWINVNGGPAIMRMAEAVRTLHKEMVNSHSDGFCVLMVSDYYGSYNSESSDPSNSGVANGSYEQFYQRFADITRAMSRNGYLPEQDITPNTTIADVKGKIILKLQLNGNGNNNNGSAGTNADNLNDLLKRIKSWENVDGCEALLNWWTASNGSNIFYAPMTYGKTGSFTYTPYERVQTGTVWGAPTYDYITGVITLGTEGIARQAASLFQRNQSGSNNLSWRSNINLTTPDIFTGSEGMTNPNTMWYVYGAQAKAGDNYTTARDLIDDATSAITNYYSSDLHNRFFMTYLGGAGNENGTTYTPTSIASNFVDRWNQQRTSIPANYPYGWVLFNLVPAEGSNPASGTAGAKVQEGVRRVVMRNNQFPLNRKRGTPNGDTKGVVNGPSLF